MVFESTADGDTLTVIRRPFLCLDTNDKKKYGQQESEDVLEFE